MRAGSKNVPTFMNPAVFISSSVLVGMLFAFQEWLSLRHMGYHMHAPIFFESWGFQFFIWGTLCWLLWRFLGSSIQRARVGTILMIFLPLSIGTSVAQQMLFVFIFRSLPLNHSEMTYWQRLSMYIYAELLDNLLIFWCAFLLFRGIGYYQRYREQEQAKADLEIQLANAQLAALRMQLNPHFLFNTMNSISSLMRSDVEAADTMLEQLSCLLRLSLERGESQLISLRDELDFIELYLGMQGQRYAGRLTQSVNFAPELYDALVPSMLLQPIVENAYVHGIAKTDAKSSLCIVGQRDGDRMRICVMNSGVGLNRQVNGRSRRGVGLRNIEERLSLHYGIDATFEIIEIDQRTVQVTIVLPLQFLPDEEALQTRLGTR
ncbi:MAG TPA: histidine kinase [Terracidiphilus sp.]|nr:histidine kinase [Terracidiphilus sp.]